LSSRTCCNGRIGGRARRKAGKLGRHRWFSAQKLRQTTLLFNPLDAAGRTCRYNPFSHIDRRDEVDVINELQKIGAMLFPAPDRRQLLGRKRADSIPGRCRLCRGNRR
jgi:hypothetical protein